MRHILQLYTRKNKCSSGCLRRLKTPNRSTPWPAVVIPCNRWWHWRFGSERLAMGMLGAMSKVRKKGKRRRMFTVGNVSCEYKRGSACLGTMKNVDQTASFVHNKTCNKYTDHNFCFKCCKRVDGKCFGCRSSQYRCKTCKLAFFE